MTPLIARKRTVLVAALTVTSALAGFVVAGTALGADWFEYEGRVAAGNAYFVPVPAKADTLSFVLTPGLNATAPVARFTVLDPEDGRVGNFDLGDGTRSADLVQPREGAYILYVYDLAEATLTVRLEAPDASDLRLARAEVAREDKVVLRAPEGGAVAREVVVDLPREPLFVTLLYQGRVENLEATVESPKGRVLTIAGESGTSYAPGLSVGSAGARDADLMNLASGAYRIGVKADALDGTLYFTSLQVERPVLDEPVVPEEPPRKAPRAPVPPPAPGTPFAEIPSRVPVAVAVEESALLIALPGHFAGEDEATDEDEAENEDGAPHRHGAHGAYTTVVVYDPADNLVGAFDLSTQKPAHVLRDLPQGEYVVFAHAWSGREGDVVAGVASATGGDPPLARPIALVEGVEDYGHYEAPVAFEESREQVFATPPLGLFVDIAESELALDFRAVISGRDGEVYRQEVPLNALFLSGWSAGVASSPASARGAYAVDLTASSFIGNVKLHWITYDRAVGAIEEPPKVADDDAEAEAPAQAPRGLPRLRDLLGIGT